MTQWTHDPAIGARFPEGFSWGVATSAHQIEGATHAEGRGPSIWDTFSHTPGRTARGETADVAADHYHRFTEDVDLMADLGVDSYRFSVSWSRVLPEGTGAVNEPGISFYRHLCERLREAGIRPLVTLYHWDLPQALQDRGGWANPAIVEWFGDYAVTVKQSLADLVSDWITLNEPWCMAFLGHGSGVHAPGITDPGTAYLAAHHQLLAHHHAVSAMRRADPRPEDRYTIALNLIPTAGRDPDGADDEAAAAVDTIHSELFLQGVLDGTYPEAILAHHERFGVADRIDVAELAAVRQPIDHLAVNYYNITHIAHRPGAPAPGEYPGADGAVIVTPPGELTEMGWGIEPHGLAGILRRLANRYPDLPLLISENGAAFPDEVGEDGMVHDRKRIAYLADHLEVVADAVEEEIEVEGYCVWSLLDNFEWSFGYDKRFGLVRVDPLTLERMPKDSALWYRDVIAAHRTAHR